MGGRGIWTAAAVALVAAAATGGTAGGAAGGGAGPAVELLPDFDQRAPAGLVVTAAGSAGRPRFRLGFDSAVDNAGTGPFVIRGARASRAEPVMTASQKVRLTNGRSRTYRRVGFLRYVSSPTHTHWHLLGFERYELRRPGDYELVVRDRKTGFCLGDRYANPSLRPRAPVFTGRCGISDPGLLAVEEGTSVGYTDRYPANFHGQYLDVTDVAPGRYILVHRVNPHGWLVEASYENNAAAVLIRISWPNGRRSAPAVTRLATCEDREYCDG